MFFFLVLLLCCTSHISPPVSSRSGYRGYSTRPSVVLRVWVLRLCVGCVRVCACVLCLLLRAAAFLSFLFIFRTLQSGCLWYSLYTRVCVSCCVGSTSCVLFVVLCRAALINFPPLNGFGLFAPWLRPFPLFPACSCFNMAVRWKSLPCSLVSAFGLSYLTLCQLAPLFLRGFAHSCRCLEALLPCRVVSFVKSFLNKLVRACKKKKRGHPPLVSN